MKKILLWTDKTSKTKITCIFLYQKKVAQLPLLPLTQVCHCNELLSLHGSWLHLTPYH